MATQQQQSKPVKQQPLPNPQVKQAVGKQPQKPTKRAVSGKPNSGPTIFSLNKTNYQLLALGSAVVALGFILMAGGKMTDPHVFDYSVIYSVRRVDVAPTMVILGYAIVIFGIMHKPNGDANADDNGSKPII